jgi:hypothetical protein
MRGQRRVEGAEHPGALSPPAPWRQPCKQGLVQPGWGPQPPAMQTAHVARGGRRLASNTVEKMGQNPL